jgi:hypothetical protein
MSNITPIRVTGTLTPTGTQDVNIVSPNPLPVSVTASVLPTGAATEATLLTLETNVAKNYGTWFYYAGVVGTVVVAAGQRVVGISAFSVLGGSLAINGGADITLPPGVAINIEPKGNLIAPTIVFTETDTYIVEVVS